MTLSQRGVDLVLLMAVVGGLVILDCYRLYHYLFLFLCPLMYVEMWIIHTTILRLICVPVGSEGSCCHSLVKCLSVFLLLMRITMRKRTTTAHLHPS